MYLVCMVWESCRDGFCEETSEDASQAEPVSAGFKTDLLLSKSEPASDFGSASVITYLRDMLHESSRESQVK